MFSWVLHHGGGVVFYQPSDAYGACGNRLACFALFVLDSRSSAFDATVSCNVSERTLTHVILFHRKDKIQWECDNGGQLWTGSVVAGYATPSSIPNGFCATGFSSLNVAFIAGLCIDLVFQVRVPICSAQKNSLGFRFTCSFWFGDSRSDLSTTLA